MPSTAFLFRKFSIGMFSIRNGASLAAGSLRRRCLSTSPAQRTSSSIVKPLLLFTGLSAVAITVYSLYPTRSRNESALPLSPSRFTPATLIESINASSDTKLLTFSVPPELLNQDNPDAFAPIWSIFVKDSDIQVERAYTPLEGVDQNGHMKFWIKKYGHGEVGRWLHSKRVGDSIEIRGPVKTWSALWQDGQWDEVVLVSGGTGITPFYQLLHSTFKARDTPFIGRLTLLHGSRSSRDLPPPSMMDFLVSLSQEQPDKFQLRMFAESTSDSSAPHSFKIETGRIGKPAIQNALGLTPSTPWWRRFLSSSTPTTLPPQKRVLVLVCGPEAMINAIAGPYGRNYSQGQVGGILAELGLQSHQVWKL